MLLPQSIISEPESTQKTGTSRIEELVAQYELDPASG